MYYTCQTIIFPCLLYTSEYYSRILTTRTATWYIMVMSVCVHVCLSFDNFRKPWRRKFICAHAISTDYGSSSYMKVIGQGQGYKSQKRRKFLFPQCKTSIGNNSRSIKIKPRTLHAAWGFRVWRIEWCNRHFCHVTGSEHAFRGGSALDLKAILYGNSFVIIPSCIIISLIVKRSRNRLSCLRRLGE